MGSGLHYRKQHSCRVLSLKVQKKEINELHLTHNIHLHAITANTKDAAHTASGHSNYLKMVARNGDEMNRKDGL